ncbi:MAG TPA: hypothetical protein VEI05_02715, partial [Burkholderiaceae bacterium]|nr:hypothetical protein [Burkholderiaceae bacterium]
GRQKFDRVWVVTSVDSTGIKGTWNGQPLTLTLDLNVLDSPQFTNSDKRLLNFPLEVGKKWKSNNNFVDHTYKEMTGSETYSVEVTGYEKVKVQAGEFDAFKLKAKSSWNMKSGDVGTHVFTYWYAPKVRAVVKDSELIASQGWGLPEWTCELAEFQLQP